MSVHLGCGPGDVAPFVLLPGDPRRARFIAESYLENVRCTTEVRGALGFTGTYRGTPVSVHATGMGQPSMAIYAHELVVEYGARRLVRVGTCGSLQRDLALGALVAATAASSDSAMNDLEFDRRHFAPAADPGLLFGARDAAARLGTTLRFGTVVTSDLFYGPEGVFQPFARHGVLAAEMEAAALYTTAARHGVAALALLTVSDSIVTGEAMTASQRELSLGAMIELALSLA